MSQKIDRFLGALVAVVIIVGGLAVLAAILPNQPPQSSAPRFDHRYERLLVNMAYMRSLAEAQRDSVRLIYPTAQELVSTQSEVMRGKIDDLGEGKLFKMDSTKQTTASPWSVGVWVCPLESCWIKVSAFGEHGELVASTDNFREQRKK